MQIRQLRHFLAAVDTGSMTQAARDQNVTQPTLSRSIRMLEMGLKVDLLERLASGVLPTRYGQVLAEHARTIVNGIDHAREDVAGLRAGRMGHVRLGLGESALMPAVARAIGEISARHADLQISLDYDLQENQIARLRRGEIDAIIDLRRRDLETQDLEFQKLAQVSFVVLARPEHPLAGREMVTRAQLSRAAWAILDQPGAERFYRMVLGPEENAGRIRLRCSAPAMLRMLAQQGDVLVMQARLAGSPDSDIAPLVQIATDMPPMQTDLCVITRGRAQMTGALRLAMQHIGRALAQHVGEQEKGATPSHVRNGRASRETASEG
ncbi:MAG TPA: LysR family transcriptional regulator [Novosphingobium sp.]|nr:LysR family transcriptional regulator [Novosphingobium sp.]